MTMPQVSALVGRAHCVEAVEALVMHCQACILVVVVYPLLSTGVVVMVVGHPRASSRRRGCWNSTSRLEK